MRLTQKLTFTTLAFLTLIIGMSPALAAARPLFRGAHKQVCSADSVVEVHCSAQVMVDAGGNPDATPSQPAGYSPTQFHSAYQLPTTSSNPATIAVVDAYDDPRIASDLATYDSTFGLPVFPACTAKLTTACFMKVNQNGGTAYPFANTSWSLETSLDVETAHQICQNCKLILVEASSASYTNLMAAVDRARLLGATVISNSYGSSEFAGETTYDAHFNYPGIAFVFSSGDAGYGVDYPAASPYVTAAGGTSLVLTSLNARQAETVWDGSGSGCSAYEKKPVFQLTPLCARRTVVDVAADADPNTGAAVYDSYAYGGAKGWFQVGGTSLAAPLIAGIYGLANNVPLGSFANTLPYSNLNYATNMFDVIVGSNGNCKAASAGLCQAAAGYDGPSGLGAPIGLGAF